MKIFYYNFAMNEMYSMGLSLHSIGTVTLLVMIFVNLFILLSFKEFEKYKRLMSVVLLPLTATILGFVVFTGVIMMAAKHLHFSVENIAMILISLMLIFSEIKRSKYRGRDFDTYKPFARRILQIEFVSVLIISIWMWIK